MTKRAIVLMYHNIGIPPKGIKFIEDGTFSRKVALEDRKMVVQKFSDNAMGDRFENVLMNL